jgi:hypothetical protein
MNGELSIVYVGELTVGMTAHQRFRALEDLGHKVWPVNSAERRRHRAFCAVSRVTDKLFRTGVPALGPLDVGRVGERVLDLVRSHPVDVLWLDKARAIRPGVLRRVKQLRPRCAIVGYSPDDMAARHNQSGQFLAGLPWHDVYFTTKSYGVSELQGLGCPRVCFVGNAFDPHTHRPVPVSAARKEVIGAPVGFVGTFEDDRARAMDFLAGQGIDVRVYGGVWNSFRPASPRLRIEGRPVYADEYAEAICAFDINLCFLRRINRDLQTQRSVEIPACGAFMLAERTDEHLDLFKEGVEAEFFASDEELLEKVRYYLTHPAERQRIAAAGRERCLRSGYSYHDRMRWMLETAVAGSR